MQAPALAITAFLGLSLGTALAAPPARKGSPAAKPATGSAATVSYERDVQPLLSKRCGACHGGGNRLGGFQIDTREAILTGGQATHPVVRVGKGAESYLVRLVSGKVPGKIMPAKGPRLTPQEVALLTKWIDQGLSFGSAKTTAVWRAPLAPRRPALPPAASGVENPIDRLLQPYFRERRIAPAALVDDRTFARRAYLDLIGLPPTPEQLRAFLAECEAERQRRQPAEPIRAVGHAEARGKGAGELTVTGSTTPLPQSAQSAKSADSSPSASFRVFRGQSVTQSARAALVRLLLGRNREYAEHWLTFWNDLLRNDYVGTGYIDGGRAQITGWLYEALETNKPYDRFVAELVNPTPESAGFTKGIVWRGVVNASQMPHMQAAQNVSQVFMGINLKCASCHNSFISTWKLADAYGMAGIYAEKPLEMVRCDRPTGEVAPIKFLYPELGSIDGTAPAEKRKEQLAAILTSKENGRLARTLVNRMWARLMGRGLVEPADEMDNRPWDPDLLDWLAADFADHGYDVKRLLELIATSRAYQMPSVGLPSERAADFTFAGPVVKRISAEQFVDSVAQLTGVWSQPATQFRVVRGRPVLPTGVDAQLRFQTGTMRSGSAEVDVDVTGAEVLSLVVTDAGNGGNSDWADWVNPRLVGPNGEIPLTQLKWHSASTGYGQIRINQSVVEKPLRLGDQTYETGIGTHANSVINYVLPPGVTRFKARVGPDAGALESPGAQTSIQAFVVTGNRSMIEARASMALADPLTRALGRPNREQVVTQRATVATTLQALELTNGPTLTGILAAGAAHWAEQAKSPTELVNGLYERALGRLPTLKERESALALVGSPVRKEGVEDLLWALTMLPEFQLIY